VRRLCPKISRQKTGCRITTHHPTFPFPQGFFLLKTT
jgi:hypothetical protein